MSPLRRPTLRRGLLAALAVLPLVLATAAAFGGRTSTPAGSPGGGTPGTSSHFQLVGHDPLFGRGMNAALALYGRYVYVGNRTDGSDTCGVGDPRAGVSPCPHPHPGILIVDTLDPAHPKDVGEIGQPYAALTGITTRELRVWPQAKLLMVMSFRCSSVIHACPAGTDAQFPFDFKFFDLSDPVHPRFISSYVPTSKAGVAIKPHEMYLWVDPHNARRALLWVSFPSTSVDPARPNFEILDLSKVPAGSAPVEIAEANWDQFFPGADNPANYDFDLALHSMAPTADGKVTYLAHLRGGTGVLDTSAVVADTDDHFIDLTNSLLSPAPGSFVHWGAGNVCAGGTAAGCSESHSAVPVPGRPYELNTDEVYGTFTTPSFGWPWGWMRLLDVHDPATPKLVGQYQIFQNTPAFQPSVDPATEQFTSYSSHNPTVTPDLAVIAWHSGGLQAIDITNPAKPTQAGWYSPTPLASVATEDPALNRGSNKVTMWSYPIVHNGLIYVIDIRNGLYILRYTGPHAGDLASLRFLEGNSNLGDAVRLSQVHGG
ncbi:MAG TPA: hypothetical protein VF995_00180 [Actinomycetota bacterium]